MGLSILVTTIYVTASIFFLIKLTNNMETILAILGVNLSD